MDDLIFNLEDMNISEESMDFIDSKPEVKEEEEKKEQVTATEETQEAVVEETKEKEETSLEDAPSSDNNSSQSTLYALAQYLKEEGVLFVEEELEKVENLDDLKDLIKKSNEQARYANLNESQRRYQEALESGVPKDQFEDIEREIQTFTNIKEEDVVENQNLRYEIIAIDLMNQGIAQDKAIKLAKLSLADESNVNDAKEALKNIIAFKTSKFKELVESNKTEREATIKDIKDNIFSREKLLDTKLTDITKNKLFDLITTKVDSDDQGRPLNKLQKWQRENPVESSLLLNYLFMMTNEGKDLNLIKKSAGSKAAQELERKLKNMSFDKNGSLIIPDHMFSSPKRSSGDSTEDNNLTINI